MIKTFTPLLPPAPASLPVPTLCQCKHSISEKCLSKRWQIDVELSQILDGCSCPCHVASNGAYMPAGAWAARRVQKQRDIERVQALNESRMQSKKGQNDANKK